MKLNREKLLYYRDLLLGALVAICTAGGIGHLLDWLAEHKQVDWQVSLGLFTAGISLVVFSPNRFNVVFNCFLTIAVCGTLGAVASRSLVGMPLILPSVVIVYAMMRWKGHLLK